jgi:opacity protein-like surface antigen
MMSFVRVLALSAVLAVSAFAADVTGKWVGKMETPNGSRDVIFNLKQDGEKLTGSTTGRGGDTPISDGSVKGDDVAFTVVRSFNGQEFKTNYKGTVAGSDLKLKFTMMEQDREITLKKE